MKKKLTGRWHDCPCIEVEWGADPRFTRCSLCGKERFYPQGYSGQSNYTDTGMRKLLKGKIK